MTAKNNPRACALPGKMSTRSRDLLPARAFGLPKERKYPMYRMARDGSLIPSGSHASNAKARAQQEYDKGNLSAAKLKQIDRKADKVLKECGVKGKKRNPNAKVVFLAKQGKVTVSVQQVGRNEYLVSAMDGPHAIGGGPLTKKKAQEWVENATANVSANTGKDWYVVRNDIGAHVERKSLRSRANNPGTGPDMSAAALVSRLKF